MRGITMFIEHFFWGMFWVFALLIVGLAILHWIEQANSGGVFGRIASWINGAATP